MLKKKNIDDSKAFGNVDTSPTRPWWPLLLFAVTLPVGIYVGRHGDSSLAKTIILGPILSLYALLKLYEFIAKPKASKNTLDESYRLTREKVTFQQLAEGIVRGSEELTAALLPVLIGVALCVITTIYNIGWLLPPLAIIAIISFRTYRGTRTLRGALAFVSWFILFYGVVVLFFRYNISI